MHERMRAGPCAGRERLSSRRPVAASRSGSNPRQPSIPAFKSCRRPRNPLAAPDELLACFTLDTSWTRIRSLAVRSCLLHLRTRLLTRQGKCPRNRSASASGEVPAGQSLSHFKEEFAQLWFLCLPFLVSIAEPFFPARSLLEERAAGALAERSLPRLHSIVRREQW
jgi:hypothetical protein